MKNETQTSNGVYKQKKGKCVQAGYKTCQSSNDWESFLDKKSNNGTVKRSKTQFQAMNGKVQWPNFFQVNFGWEIVL